MPGVVPSYGNVRSLCFRGAGIGLVLGLAETMQEQRIIGDGFLNQLLEQKQLRTVDDRINALLERLEGCKGLKGVSQKDDGRLAALVHRHSLQRLQGQVFPWVVGRKWFFEDND